MILVLPRDDDFTITTQAFLACDVEEAVSLEHVVNLLGFGMPMDSLLLPGSKTVQIAEVLIGIKKWNLLHLLAGKARERANVLKIHRSYCN